MFLFQKKSFNLLTHYLAKVHQSCNSLSYLDISRFSSIESQPEKVVAVVVLGLVVVVVVVVVVFVCIVVVIHVNPRNRTLNFGQNRVPIS